MKLFVLAAHFEAKERLLLKMVFCKLTASHRQLRVCGSTQLLFGFSYFV